MIKRTAKPGIILAIFIYSILAPVLSAAQGLLRVHPENPLYFTDNSGNAIYLAGHQIFVDLQDNTFDKSLIYDNQTVLNWPWYIQFLKARNLNYVRNWTEFTTGSASGGPRATPMPYERVDGFGVANDNLPRFDLSRFDQSFFNRMRSRALDLQNNGIYLTVMFFETYAFTADGGWDGWRGNVFNSENNINDIDADTDGDGEGVEFFTTPSPDIVKLQEDYVRKVIDTLNDLDNIIFEVGNEIGFGTPASWHYNIVEVIRSHEATKPKQHLILLSGAGPLSISRDEIVNGPADLYAALGDWADYLNDPPVNNENKPGIMDLDHIAAGQRIPIHPWQALTRGYHYNLYDHPFESPESESSEWELTRRNVGATVTYSRKFQDLSKMLPSPTVSSTQYALVNPGVDYLVLQPGRGVFTVELRAGTYNLEWFNPATAITTPSTLFTATTGTHTFTPPFDGSAVLFLSLSSEFISDSFPSIDIQFNSETVRAGGLFFARFIGEDLSPSTYFDVRFRPPGSRIDEVRLNWQQGTTAAFHRAPIDSIIGTWIVTGVRAHEMPTDHRGGFVSVVRPLTVETAP